MTNAILKQNLPARAKRFSESETGGSQLFFVGEHEALSDIEAEFRDITIHHVSASEVLEVPTFSHHNTLGILLIGGIAFVKKVMDRLNRLSLPDDPPLHAVMTSTCSNRQARRLHRMGARSVIDLKTERQILAEIVMDLSTKTEQPKLLGIKDRRFDSALRSRARLLADNSQRLKIWCHDGIVYLAGAISSLSTKKRLHSHLMAAPGVDSVMTERLQLEGSGTNDKDLEAEVVRQIRGHKDLRRLSTVSISVSENKAVLVGTVPDTRLSKKLNTLVGSIFGIKAVSNLIVVSRKKFELFHKQATEMRKLLQRYLIHTPLTVTVIDKTVIVGGTVDQQEKRAIASRLLQGHPAVEKVINKVKLASPRPIGF